MEIFGAPEGTKLEPSDLTKVFETLAEWEACLKAEPEVVHRLRELGDRVEDGASKPQKGKGKRSGGLKP